MLDNGTGRITGMALQGHDDLRDLWKSMMQPLTSLGPLAVRSGNKTGTDHLSFIPFGVPAFNYDQLTRGYNHTHHSQVDDYNHVVPSDVAQAATIMAVNAWQLANLPAAACRAGKKAVARRDELASSRRSARSFSRRSPAECRSTASDSMRRPSISRTVNTAPPAVTRSPTSGRRPSAPKTNPPIVV